MQNQEIVLNITMTPAGVQFVLDQLKKLPIETAGDLYLDIKSQAMQQLTAMQAMQPMPPADPGPDAKRVDESSGETD